MLLRRSCGLVVLLTLLELSIASAGGASILVAENAHSASIAVDATGDAQVSWIAANGGRDSIVIARSGGLQIGGRLAGRDVSHAIATVAVPLLEAIRQG